VLMVMSNVRIVLDMGIVMDMMRHNYFLLFSLWS
jgi:hypothetical protein